MPAGGRRSMKNWGKTMITIFFVLWLLLAVGGGFLLFFGGLLASWIGEEMVCFLLATALLALAGALIIQLREQLRQTRRRLEEETDRLRRMEEKLDRLLDRGPDHKAERAHTAETES